MIVTPNEAFSCELKHLIKGAKIGLEVQSSNMHLVSFSANMYKYLQQPVLRGMPSYEPIIIVILIIAFAIVDYRVDIFVFLYLRPADRNMR